MTDKIACDGNHGGVPCADPQCWLRDVIGPEYPNYTLRHITDLNLARCLRWHPEGIRSWSLSDWAVALAGEVGEADEAVLALIAQAFSLLSATTALNARAGRALDLIKKLNRGRDGLVGNKIGLEVLHTNLAKELADVYLYLDLLATAADIDLPAAIRQKFNEVSERNNFPERLE